MVIKRFIYVSFLMCLMSGIFVLSALAQSFSTKELLEYSLDTVRTKMDEAVNENQKLSSKNSSIRKRILFLKKEMREMDDKLMQLKEGAIDIKNGIKLDAKELKIEEKRFNSLLDRKRHLEFERDSVKKQIETLTFERKMDKEETKTIQFDMKELEGQLQEPASSSLLDYFAEEKVKLMDMIREYRGRIENNRDKIDRYQLEMTDYMRQKEIALRKKESLERTMADWKLRLHEEEAREALLDKTVQRWRKSIMDKGKAMDENNQARREYIIELTRAIEGIKLDQQNIADQFDYQQKEMARHLSLLKKENEELFRYYKALEAEDLLKQKQEAEKHTALILEEQRTGVEQTRAELQEEMVQLQDKIVQQEKMQESLKRDEQRVQSDLKDLTARVEEAKRSVAVFRKDAFGKKQAELQKALKEQEERLERLDFERQKAQAQLAGRKQQLERLKQQKIILGKETEDQNAMLAELAVEHEDLLKQQKEFSRLVEKNIDSFKEEIEEVQMRKKALEASVDVVHKKFQAGENEVQDFESEQAELSRYLEVLKRENVGLQRKLEDLKG